MSGQYRGDTGAVGVIERLVQAINDHDLEALVACFDDNYVNETPAHPQRGFHGNEQVRRNWTQILAAVPELRARVLRRAVDGDTVWTEWGMSGTRRDGAPFQMAGVAIFRVGDAKIASTRFYLEPVEQTGGDVDAAVSGLLGDVTAGTEISGANS